MKYIIIIAIVLLTGCHGKTDSQIWGEELMATWEKCQETFKEPCSLIAAPDSAEDKIRAIYDEMLATPVESTRRVLLSGSVKSNIEGVITLNDDCKITVIGEE